MKDLAKGFVLVLAILCSELVLANQGGIHLSARNYFSGEPASSEYPLEIAELHMDISVHGALVKTRVDLLIHNPTETDDLEAELSFPLPASAVVSSYALDVEGVMVEGVVVEKEKARASYEAIVAERIDPGLLQIEAGNRFSTRIFPLASEDSRRLRIEFTSQLMTRDGVERFVLPLVTDRAIGEFKLTLTSFDGGRPPKLSLPEPLNLKFRRKTKGYFAQDLWKNLRLNGEINLAPRSTGSKVRVAQSDANSRYILINDTPPTPKNLPPLELKRLGIFWDASLSREQHNHQREIDLLRRVLKINQQSLTQLDLVVMRHSSYELYSFPLPQKAEALFQLLAQLTYDGATDLGQLNAYSLPQKSDLYLLFSDGKNTLVGNSADSIKHSPLHVITSATDAHKPYLAHLAGESSGGFFDLTRSEPESIAPELTQPIYRFMGASIADGDLEVFPLDGLQPGKYFPVIARLSSDVGRLQLHYGVNGEILHTSRIKLTANKIHADLVRAAEVAWSSAAINQAGAQAVPEREKIISLSKAHGVATDMTSLLVLESLDQYLDHRITPPASMPEWREEYDEEMLEILAEEAETTGEYREHLVDRWEALVDWWENDVDPSKLTKHDANANSNIASPEALQRVTGGIMVSAAADESGTLEEIMVTGIRASDSEPTASIQLQPWTPDRPYLRTLAAADKDKAYAVYLQERKSYGQLPAFYLETGEYFYREEQPLLARQLVSNLLEITSPDTSLPRVAAYKFMEWRDYDLAIQALEIMLRNNPEQPQSSRDLALALIARADTSATVSLPQALTDYRRAAELLRDMIYQPWSDSFEGIELIALMELNALLARFADLEQPLVELDPRLKKRLDVDLRVVISWNADQTDMDLWVTEPPPYGEKVFYQHSASQLGGRISNDMTRGFGPEEYLLKNAPPGSFQILADYFGSNTLMPTGAVKVKADIYLNYGQPNQQHQTLVIELEDGEDAKLCTLGEVTFSD